MFLQPACSPNEPAALRQSLAALLEPACVCLAVAWTTALARHAHALPAQYEGHDLKVHGVSCCADLRMALLSLGSS